MSLTGTDMSRVRADADWLAAAVELFMVVVLMQQSALGVVT